MRNKRLFVFLGRRGISFEEERDVFEEEKDLGGGNHFDEEEKGEIILSSLSFQTHRVKSSAQRVPEPDPLPGIFSIPDPIQF